MLEEGLGNKKQEPLENSEIRGVDIDSNGRRTESYVPTYPGFKDRTRSQN